MRIAMIAPFATEPKMTVKARMLPMARALAARGHYVKVVVPPWDCPERSGKTESWEGVDLVNVPLGRGPFGIGHFVTTCRLISTALGIEPDVVYAFKPIGYTGLIVAILWLAKRLRILDVGLVLDSDDWEGRGGWSDKLRRAWWKKRLAQCQELWCLRHCDVLTVASRGLQTLAWAIGVSPGVVHYVPNGVPDDFLSALEHQERAEGVLKSEGSGTQILLFTRFVESSVERIIRLTEEIKRLDETVGLFVVGDLGLGDLVDSEADRRIPQLLHAARLAGVHDSVMVTGWVSLDVLPRCFARSEVAIFPSDDNLVNRCKSPVKLLELMVAGKAIVADRVGEIVECIEDEVSGVLVDPGDDRALACAAIKLLRDADRRRRLGIAARGVASGRFSWKNIAMEVEAACSSAKD